MMSAMPSPLTSPAASPALEAGLPLCTCWTTAPCPLASPIETPRYACSTLPLEINVSAIDLTVFDGIANPTPSLPPESLRICELTPITSPLMLRSGPPELPWLMAASVWIESLIVKLFGASIWRWSALTIPLVTVSSRPNGLPIAIAVSPTCTAFELPNCSGCRTDWGAPSTLITPRSVDGSVPTTEAL